MPHSVPQLYQNRPDHSLPGNMPHRAKTWPKSAGWQSPWTHAATWPESVRCRSPWKHTTACQNWARIGPKLPASGRFWSISGTLWYVLRDALSMGVLLAIPIWFCRLCITELHISGSNPFTVSKYTQIQTTCKVAARIPSYTFILSTRMILVARCHYPSAHISQHITFVV